MPVVQMTQDEIDTWREAPTLVALQLQRPLPGDALAVVTIGSRKDGDPTEPPGAGSLL